jgi:hypothetical protein
MEGVLMMIDRIYAEQTLQFLVNSSPHRNRIRLEPGLTDHEIESIQSKHGLVFPPDLRLLLQTALPLTDDARDFPDWRHGDSMLHSSLEVPRSCIECAVRDDGFWWSGWGDRPAAARDAALLSYRAMGVMPRLIRIYSHRYISSYPALAGNPVMSLVDFDFIYYGHDLASYLEAEFGAPNPYPVPELPRYVPMWAEAVEATGGWFGPTATL